MGKRSDRPFGSHGLAALLLVFGLAGCGGGGEPPSVPPAANVGPSGATVVSADGKATLTVPAGAVASPITVTLEPTPDAGADPQIVPGTSYRLVAPDVALAQPATLQLDVPAGLLAGAHADRKRAQAYVTPYGFMGCELQVDSSTGTIKTPIVVQPGTDLPPQSLDLAYAGFALVCLYEANAYKGLAVNGTPTYSCPTGFYPWGSAEVYAPGYTPLKGYWTEPVSNEPTLLITALYCIPTAPSQPQVASSTPGGPVTTLATSISTSLSKAAVNLQVLHTANFALLMDVTPPSVHLSATITPVGTDQAKIRLTAAASDNVGVKQVSLVRWDLDRTAIASGVVTMAKTNLASFAAAPYVWESAPMPLAQVYNGTYIAAAVDAAGNVAHDTVKPTLGPPVISGFSAAPASVPYGGGSTVLSWSANSATRLFIDQGIGEVTGLSSKSVDVGSATTFTLTALNGAGATTASTTVEVSPRPAPVISNFAATPASLPAGGGAVTLSWVAGDADTLSIDNGVGTVTGSSKVVNVTASTTFTLTATNTTGAASKTTAVVVATGTDRFVSTTAASDVLPCTQAAPCKNIATAMNGAPAGSNIYLADGTYDTTNQNPTAFNMPSGVTLRATNADAVTLQGLQITMTGSGNFDGLRLENNTQLFASSAAAASVTLSGVRVRGNGAFISGGAALHLGGNVVATMTPGALPAGQCSMPSGVQYAVAIVRGSAQFTVQGCTFDGHNVADPVQTFLVIENGRLTLDAASIVNLPLVNGGGGGVINVGGYSGGSAAAPASLTMKNGSSISNVNTSGNFTAAGLIIGNFSTVTLDNASFSNLKGPGVVAGNGNGLQDVSLTIRNGSTISQTDRALLVDLSGGGATSLVINGASFTGNANGLRVKGDANTVVDIHQLSYTGNATTQPAGTLDNQISAANVKLRNSSFGNNGGVGLLLGNPAGSTASLDLGTTASPGNNTLAGNAGVGLYVIVNGTQTVNAVGNTWNASVPGVSGVPATDAQGHYPTGTTVTGPKAHGSNFNIPTGVTLNL